MSTEDPVPWTFTAWGEDTYEHRQARRALDEERELRLSLEGVDPRLIDVVWRSCSLQVGALIEVDLRHTGWMDDRALRDEEPSVPLCALGFEERGVVARRGQLFEWTPGSEREVDASWVWEQLLGPGLARSPVHGPEREALLHELEQLGGPALRAFAERRLPPTDPAGASAILKDEAVK